MDVKDYCSGLEVELMAWKAKLYDAIVKTDKLEGKDREKILGNIGDLKILVSDLEDRIQLLRHLRSLLRPNGRILLTTGCMDGGIEFELVNLIHATTKGWGRLPYKDEMLRQLSEAGFERNFSVSLIPGDRYYAFVGYRPL